jgi:peptidoglycan hydrolase-like protein with peptidoglycan-binding domain
MVRLHRAGGCARLDIQTGDNLGNVGAIVRGRSAGLIRRVLLVVAVALVAGGCQQINFSKRWGSTQRSGGIPATEIIYCYYSEADKFYSIDITSPAHTNSSVLSQVSNCHKGDDVISKHQFEQKIRPTGYVSRTPAIPQASSRRAQISAPATPGVLFCYNSALGSVYMASGSQRYPKPACANRDMQISEAEFDRLRAPRLKKQQVTRTPTTSQILLPIPSRPSVSAPILLPSPSRPSVSASPTVVDRAPPEQTQTSVLAPTVSRNLVMAVQKRLADLGFDAGPADGAVGGKTRTAIRAFQRTTGAPMTGEVTEDLLKRLNQEVKTAAARPPQTAPVKPLTKAIIPADYDFGTYHALVIGNISYRSLPRLETAVKDAETVGRLLRDNYGFNVTTLTDVTRAGIIDAFDGLRSRLTENDNLLVYYAGHGKLDRKADRGYWLPVDASENSRSQWLSNATITDTLKAISAKHVMVVADSCYSGTLTRGDQRGLELVAKAPDYFSKIVKRKTRTALTSGGLEPVTDRGSGGHSVFAKAFLDALRDNTAVIDGTQLFAKVREQVRLNADQTPQYSNIRLAGHEVGGDFLFVRKR